MGAEAVAAGAAVVGAATGLFGLAGSRKAGKRARIEAESQRVHQEEQSTLYKAEQAKLAQKEARGQEMLNKQIARGNRRRIRGGLFGDVEPTAGIARKTLG